MRYVILLLTLITFVGCSSGCKATQKKDMYVTFTFANTSPKELNGVKLECADKVLRAGILVPTGDKTIFDVRWPDVASGKVTFIDMETEHPYSIDLSLDVVNKQVRAGKCKHVKLRILSYDKAEIVCE